MEFTKQKEMLLEKGNQLLNLVKKKDLGLETIVEVMDKERIEELREWFFNAEEFVERYGLECQKERFAASSWIINQGERVSVGRIKNILSVIERITITK